MAAATATNTITKGLSHVQRGKDVTYNATWLVNCTAPVPGYVAQTLAQTTTPNRMPIYGDVLKLITGEGIVTDVGDQYEDTSVFALDFNATPSIPGEWLNWNIVVGWRKPQPGNDAEQPDSVDQKPLSRPPRYRLEYRNSTEEINIGQLLTELNPDDEGFEEGVGDPITMTNTAGQPFPELVRDISRPVIVISQNVKSPLDSLALNSTFENSTNKTAFTVKFILGSKKFTLTIKPYRARFLMSEVSETQFEESQTFVKQETRIEIARVPYFVDRFNEGLPTADDLNPFGTSLLPRFDDGTPIPPPHPLNIDGNLAGQLGLDDFVTRTYLILRAVEYGSLV